MLFMCEEGIKASKEIPEVLGIIKKWGLSSMTDIDNMFNMSHRNDTCVDVVNNLPRREDGRKKRD